MNTKQFNVLIFILNWLVTAFCFAQLRVYTGTIANQPVIVELSLNEQHAIDSGRYAYVKYGKIIRLDADRESTGILLNEQAWSADESEQIIVAKWQLKQQGERLLGQWQSTEGKTAAIQLQPAKIQSESEQAFHVLLAQQSPALQLKIQQGKTQAGIASQLVWQQGVNFNVQGIQIKNVTASGDAAINQSLKTMLQNDIGAAQDCYSMRPNRSDFKNWTDILYGNPLVLTITRHFDVYCGGAYPSNWIERHSFDRKSGLELQIDQQIYQFEAENTDAFRPLLLKTWQNSECKIKDQTCRKELAEQFAAGGISLSAIGIVKTRIIIHISYPHVAQAGDTDLIIPFSALRPFKRANATFNPEQWH